MPHQEGRFDSRQGDSIYYQSWRPDEPARANVLLLHGLGEHSGRYEELAGFLTERGYAVYALDLPGHGKSGGRPGYIADFSDYLAVAEQYLQQVKANISGQPLFLLGHSMGGLISASFLPQHQSAFSGALLSGAAVQSPLKPPPIQLLIIRLLSLLMPKLGVLQLDASQVSRDPDVVRRYEEDPLNYHGKVSARSVAELFAAMQALRGNAARIKLPLLIMHGSEDSMAAPEGSQYLYQACGSIDKTLKIYPGLYHEIFNEPEKQQIYTELAAWLDERVSAVA